MVAIIDRGRAERLRDLGNGQTRFTAKAVEVSQALTGSDRPGCGWRGLVEIAENLPGVKSVTVSNDGLLVFTANMITKDSDFEIELGPKR